jgi:hypothetical protein
MPPDAPPTIPAPPPTPATAPDPPEAVAVVVPSGPAGRTRVQPPAISPTWLAAGAGLGWLLVGGLPGLALGAISARWLQKKAG